MAALLPPLVQVLRGDGSQLQTTYKEAGTGAETMAKTTDAATTKMSTGFNSAAKAGKYLTLGVLAAAAGSVKLASDFQSASTRLVTGAGESAKNLDLVTQGMLKMAPAVGLGPTALANAMFTVESAGQHGANGLKVLQAAAEGAKIGGADATVVANGLTTALTDYHIPATNAAKVTSELISTVAAGKTTMQDLAGSLSNVLPAASAAKIGLTQVLGAMATMTGEGISAQQASQDLAGTIRSLQNPSEEQTAAMQALGLSSLDVASKLGSKGLTGTLGDLVTAITAKMGPSGLVIQDTFKKSQLAAADAKQELDAMPKSMQKIATEFQNGTITSTQWRSALKGMTVDHKQLAQQFANTVQSGKGFNDLLKAGGPSAETFSAALSKVTGGSTGMNTALALTGGNMAAFNTNVKNISGSTTEAGDHVKGWAATQKDFSTQMAQTGAQVQVVAIKIGTALMPTVQAIVKGFSGFINVLQTNGPLLITLGSAVGVVTAALIAAYVAQKVMTTYTTLASIATKGFSAAQNLGKLSVIGTTAALVAQKVAQVTVTAATAVASTAVNVFKAAQFLAKASTIEFIASLVAQKVAMAASAIATGVVTAATWAWNAAMIIATSPITLIIIAVLALIAIIVLLATHWKQVTDFIKTVWKAVADWFVSVGKSISDWWNGFWNGLFKFVDTIFKAETDGWKLIFKSVYDFFVTVGTDITTWWNGLWTGIVDWLTGYWQKAVTFYTGVFQNVLTVFQSVGANITTWWNGFWSGLGSLASGIFKNTFNFVTTIINDVINAINTITSALNTAGGAIGINIKIGKIPDLPSFDVGTSGVPGPTGAPVLAVVHGGEPVLSNAMMNGNAVIPQNVVNAVNNQQSGGGGKTVTQTNYITTTANPNTLLQQMGWLVRQMG